MEELKFLRERVEKLEAEVAALKERRLRKGAFMIEAHSAVLGAFERQPQWTFRDLSDALPTLPKKSISNVLGYLTRRRRLLHVGYGQYEAASPPSQGE